MWTHKEIVVDKFIVFISKDESLYLYRIASQFVKYIQKIYKISFRVEFSRLLSWRFLKIVHSRSFFLYSFSPTSLGLCSVWIFFVFLNVNELYFRHITKLKYQTVFYKR